VNCNCGTSVELSAPVCVIVLFAPGLDRPYPLIPTQRCRCCVRCNAFALLVTVAQERNPETSGAGRWTQAFIVLDDGVGLFLNQDLRATQQKATA
jgi:hypothetical protein